MLEFFWSLGQKGKTTVGAILMLLAAVGQAVTPDDAAALTAFSHGTATAGQIAVAVGLLHKVYKLATGQPAL